MKWVVESSPAAVTGGAEKRQLCGSPAAVTRRRGAGWSDSRCLILHWRSAGKSR
ncbi:unnamed protein product [Spirodela intermedia]|uniref:Uncharacterized protein n=1 Tax=Spirodela intermedia TaxID=51605 RepID=A0ABN7ECX8_SPIIN|nr:unnamed protein product [Spirodela intermedia]